ncbi:MAG: hypothetical protein AAGI11_16285 [Pseudomonadota bacterium]
MNGGGSPGNFAAPSRTTTLAILLVASSLLIALIGLTLWRGPHFSSFPDRTIGISLLSDITPYYRVALFLLVSGLALVAAFAVFVLRNIELSLPKPTKRDSLTLLLAAAALVNVVAALVHSDRALFLGGALHAVFLCVIWLVCNRGASKSNEQDFVLTLAIAWQATTLLFWFDDSESQATFYLPVVAAFALLNTSPALALIKRAPSATLALLFSPLTLLFAIELAYFWRGDTVTAGNTLTVALVLLVAMLILGATSRFSAASLPAAAALAVLATGSGLNQYNSEILYTNFDLFHLAERMLPLQQWDEFRSIPFLDYHPLHGFFDILPHGLYHALHGGDPLESALWGNGYFHGWFMRVIFITVLYLLLARACGCVAAFLLLWLLPLYHIVEPYNTLLLLPVLHLLTLPDHKRPLLWWLIQWLMTFALGIWRADFGLIAAAGSVSACAALAWYRSTFRELWPAATALAIALGASLMALWLLIPEPFTLEWLFSRGRDLLGIQMLAASYDHFYEQWSLLASVQYLLMPLLGATVGAYVLATLFLRRDGDKLGLNLVLVFITAVGFAISIRLFQRHSIVEGFTKTNFFYLAPLLLLWALRIDEGRRRVTAAFFIMLSFLITPKSVNPMPNSPWGARLTYPITATPFEFPALASDSARLVNDVERYDRFISFSDSFLRPGQAFYDFSNAPMLYMLAGVKLPVYIHENYWHTSESLQQSTLEELEAKRLAKQLRFVVFRRNKPTWDQTDGVDSALRGYRMAEYIYSHYKPCVRLDQLDIWLQKKTPCDAVTEKHLPPEPEWSRQIERLPADYLQQSIPFGHLPFIWANYDQVEEPTTYREELRIVPADARYRLGGDTRRCRASACYLDLRITATKEINVPLFLDGAERAVFRARPGDHAYRIRISALWHWHQGGREQRLALGRTGGFTLQSAALSAARTPDITPRSNAT